MVAPQLEPTFISAVKSGLEEGGWTPSLPLVVAFSGGADSTALLLACTALSLNGGKVHAAHFDHRIRTDSERDRHHIEYLADQLGVPVIAGVGDVPAYAKERGMSVETAGRELRYRFLADAVKEAGAQGVATGHTMDDQAETVLMNVLRGTGTRGLSGMRARTVRPAGRDWPAVAVLRPLLGLRHSDCETACRDAGVEWLEDPSNKDTTVTRNRVRHELLPLAENIREGAVPALARLADNVGQADVFLRGLAATEAPVTIEGGVATVGRGAFRSLNAALQSYVLTSMYESATGGIEGLEQDHVVAMRELADGGSGTELTLPGGFLFIVEYDKCSIGSSGSEPGMALPSSVPKLELSVPGRVELPEGFVLEASIVDVPRNLFEFGDNVAHVSPNAVRGPLAVRARSDGDRFHPLGMKSEVRLQDFFVNAHVPERLRDRVPIVTSARGIAWVAGRRIAEWAKVEETAYKAIRLELTRKAPNAGSV